MSKKKLRRSSRANLFLLLSLFILAILLTATKGSSLFTKKDGNLSPTPSPTTSLIKEIDLPAPSKSSRVSVEQALLQRRTQRKFFDKSIGLKQLSQILWSLQGVTADWGGRTAPSARSAYPLEIYAVALKVDGLAPGLYRYIPGNLKPIHKLGLLREVDLTEQSLTAAKQSSAKNAPAIIVITGNFQKMTEAFQGTPADNNVYLEAGHAAQNLYLQVETLGLGTVVIGGFDESATYRLLGSPINERVIYVIPVGYPDES